MEHTAAFEMFASGTQEEPKKSVSTATTARAAVGFEWFGEADHGVIGDDSPLISASANFFSKSLPISTNQPRTAAVAARANLVRA